MEYVFLAVLVVVGAFIILQMRRKQQEAMRDTPSLSTTSTESDRRLAEARRARVEPVTLAPKRSSRSKKKGRAPSPPAPIIPVVVVAEPAPKPEPQPPIIVPVAPPVPTTPARRVLELLHDRRSVAAALLLHEVLGPPVSRRARRL